MRLIPEYIRYVLSVFCRIDVVCWYLLSMQLLYLNTAFCVICSLLIFVSDASGDNVLEYGSCYGFVGCEYRFLLFPHMLLM